MKKILILILIGLCYGCINCYAQDLEGEINFLDMYAGGEFANIELWLTANQGKNIDVDLGICIGFAESNLGKNLTTSNNVGNVGNTDSGKRQFYTSALGAAQAIFNTLNNGFLKHIYTLDRLSRYGNRDSYVYATSPYNWHKNVKWCLSRIKNTDIPDNYQFRGTSPIENYGSSDYNFMGNDEEYISDLEKIAGRQEHNIINSNNNIGRSNGIINSSDFYPSQSHQIISTNNF